MSASDGHPDDDVDSLDAYLERVEPPPDLVARVLARARQTEASRWPRWQQGAFAGLYVAALVVLAVLGYLTGSELEHAGLRDLISLAIHDIALVRQAPGVYLTAIGDAVPWIHLAAVAGDVLLLALATRLVLRSPRSAAGPVDGAPA